MDEGVIEGGEDTSNAENKLAYDIMSVGTMRMSGFGGIADAPSPDRGPRETFSLAAPAVFLGGMAIVVVKDLCGWNRMCRRGNEQREGRELLQALRIHRNPTVCPRVFADADWLEAPQMQPQARIDAPGVNKHLRLLTNASGMKSGLHRPDD